MRNRAQIARTHRPARSGIGGLVRLAAAVAALAGCEPYVEGNGVLGEQHRTLPAFTGLEIEDGIQGQVVAGSVQSVVLKGDENVLERLETLVEPRGAHGPVLVVRASASYQSVHTVQVLVSAPVFAYVETQEASPVTVSGAAAEVFTVAASDGSHVTLEGTGGQRLVATVSGGGARLDARGYPVVEADVAITGGGFAALDASASVAGTAAGAGSRVENEGAGACEVTVTDGAQVDCAAP